MKEKTFENSSRCRVVFVCVGHTKEEQGITFWKTKISLLFQYTNHVNVKAHKVPVNNNLCVFFFLMNFASIS